MSTIVPLDVGDDEILIISYERILSEDQRRQMQDNWTTAIEAGRKTVVLDGDPSLHVVKRESLT